MFVNHIYSFLNDKLSNQGRPYLELLLQSMHLFSRFGELVISTSQNLYSIIDAAIVRLQYQMRSQLFIPCIQLHDVLLRLSELLGQFAHFLFQRG